MKFSQVCINRPVFTVVIAFILILLGVISYLELPVRFSPFYFRPVLMVSVNVPGADAEYVEENVTTPLEKSLSGTPGLDMMTSDSSQSGVTITLNFQNLTTQDFVAAQAQVLQEVDGTSLPQLADRPQIMQGGNNNMVMMLGVSDNNLPMPDLVNYVNNYVIPQLQEISGVSQVNLFADAPALRVTLDPRAMASLNINVMDVQNALRNSNTSYPLGDLLTDKQAIQLNSKTVIPDITGFENLVIAKKGLRLVYLKDIATISIDEDVLDHFYAYVNGAPGIAMEIDQTAKGNPIQVGQQVKSLIARLQPNLPAGLKIVPVFDLSSPLQGAIYEVYFSIFIAILLVVLVTLAFLGNWRATFIPVVMIPICLIGMFGVMLLLGYTINIMTLLALVLAVGLVVDDAIVVLENTHRHIEAGLSSLAAARKSIDEISFAVLGVTICLVAVYIPTLFLPANIDATYFQEFSLTLAGAIVISGFLALTLSPMMCSRLLKAHSKKGYEHRLDNVMSKLHYHYERALTWTLKSPKLVLSVLIINLILGVVFFILLPTDLLPSSPLKYIQGSLTGPNSSTTEYRDQLITPFREQLDSNPHLKNPLMYVNGGGSVFFMAQVKDWTSPEKIVNDIDQQLTQMPNFSGGAMVVDANNNVTSSQSGSLYFYVSGFGTYDEIANAAAKMQQALQNDPKVAVVNNNILFSQPEYNFNINLNLAAMLGVDLQSLNTTLSTFFGGYIFPNTTYQVGGHGYDIIMQMSRADLKDLSILQNLYVRNGQGKMISVSNLVSVTSDTTLTDRVHVNGLRGGEIDIVPANGYSMGDLIHDVDAKAAKILPQNLQIVWAGEGRSLLENASSGNLFIALGILFIYLVLAALFESFIDPIIILCTVPMCVVAGLIGLHLIGGSINIYTKIALVTLVGLVSKHGVLITQFANQLKKEGMEISEAIKKAALIRLRPILMTSLTMILGALPLVFAMGTDSIGRSQIGVIIVLGLLVGSFFSLFVVPIAYLMLGKFKTRFKS